MNDHLDHRVTKLEVRVDGHDKDIARVNSVTESLSVSLLDIRQNLTQIKWVVVGAGAAFAFQILDLKDFIKLVLTFI